VSNWYELEAEEALKKLDTNIQSGLSEAEATGRLEKYGPNELIESGLKSIWLIFWEQLTATMVVVLIIAAVVTAFLGDYKDTIAIMAIVVVNSILGTTQEYRAEKAMAALKKLASPAVKVRRDGTVKEVPSARLVPGDIVLLEAGNIVPADCRLLESTNLRAQEAALTGESEPSEKDQIALAGEDLSLGDRRNMLYLGTILTYGRGQAVVTGTGMKTELGNIAAMIQKVSQDSTPLQKRLSQLGHGLLFAILVLVGIIFILGLLRNEGFQIMFMISVSLAVAAVPEALPAVVTITLALGSQRMLKRQALIRKLPAVETLGSVTVICSDKTGTLTENRMTVTMLEVAGSQLDLNKDNKEAGPEIDKALTLLLAGAALCNDAFLQSCEDEDENSQAVGDPTEGALVVAASRLGLEKSDLEKVFPRVGELPFESERKLMTTIHRLTTPDTGGPPSSKSSSDLRTMIGDSSFVEFTKGAVDRLIEKSRGVWVRDHVEQFTPEWNRRILTAHDRMTKKGMRVLGVAFLPLASLDSSPNGEDLEKDLVFIGILGMNDPARPEVKEAVLTCKAAGIRPMMITGDHPTTAQHIAQSLSISADGQVLTGRELDKMSVEDLAGIVGDISVYARVSPEHKLKIVQALQSRGQVVAMTGDGVNDAPALKKADIGLAMGITGTDVAKEASDMVLLDDNFATIVAAVEEGRVIYDNIRKYIKNTMTGNSSAIWVMLLGPLVGMPLPLLPLQILWMNLVTDGLPSVALGIEPAERDIMHRRPYRPDENIFGRGMGWHILVIGILIGLIVLGTGYWYWRSGSDNWQTMILTTLILSRMGHILATRSEKDSLFRIGLLSNKPLLCAIALTLTMQMAMVYMPFLQSFFGTVGLSAVDLAISLALSTLVFFIVEIEKWFIRLQETKEEKKTTKTQRHKEIFTSL
jgi:P-type Ca2+ transporter type 2C